MASRQLSRSLRQRGCGGLPAGLLLRAEHAHERSSSDEVRLFCAAAAAGALAVSLVADHRRDARCYWETTQGEIDRLRRWRRVFWNLPAGYSPGFHEIEVNPFLEKHLARWTAGMAIPNKANARPKVLVPLCGKSMDMPYLCENGYGVVGVEGVQRGILDFKAEHQIRVKGMKSRTVMSKGDEGWREGNTFVPAEHFQGARKGFVFKTGDQGLGYYAETPAVWKGKVNLGKRHSPLHILEGDVFDVTPELVAAATFVTDGRFDLVYDRDALGALPPDARKEYVERLSSLLRVGGRILLIGVQYDQRKLAYDRKRYNPPPFSVNKEAIRRLFPEPSWTVTMVDEEPCSEEWFQRHPIFKKEDIKVRDVVFLIEKRGEGKSPGAVMAMAAGLMGLSGLAACALFRPS